MRYIYCSRNYETAGRLANFVRENGTPWATLINNGNIPELKRKDALIRWGCYGNSSLDSRFSTLGPNRVVNTSEALQRASNKYQALCLLTDAQVRVPGMWTSNISMIPRHEFPVLRRKFHHTRGLDIRFCTTRRVAFRKPRGDYYSKYIKGRTEYRIHIFDGRLIRSSRKIPLIQGASGLIKNSRNGWGFNEVSMDSVPNRIDLTEQCTRAMTRLGLTYGAIDVIYADATGLPYVLEVNSAPRLNQFGRRLFRRAVESYTRSRDYVPIGFDDSANTRTNRDAELLRSVLRPGLRNARLHSIFQPTSETESHMELDDQQ